jgi:dihydrodipicolinate reductase
MLRKQVDDIQASLREAIETAKLFNFSLATVIRLQTAQLHVIKVKEQIDFEIKELHAKENIHL